MWISLYHKGALCDACVYYKGNGKKGNKYIITNLTNRRQCATRVASIYGWSSHMMENFWPHFQNGMAVLQLWPKLIKGINIWRSKRQDSNYFNWDFGIIWLWIGHTLNRYKCFIHHASGRHTRFTFVIQFFAKCVCNIYWRSVLATYNGRACLRYIYMKSIFEKHLLEKYVCLQYIYIGKVGLQYIRKVKHQFVRAHPSCKLGNSDRLRHIALF